MYYEDSFWRGDRGNSLRRLRGKAATACVPEKRPVRCEPLPTVSRQFTSDVWPVSLEFTCAMALVIFPFVGYVLGFQSAVEMCPR